MIGYLVIVWDGFEKQVAYRRKCQRDGCQQSRSYTPDPAPTSYCWCTTKWKPNRFWMFLGGLRASLKGNRAHSGSEVTPAE